MNIEYNVWYKFANMADKKEFLNRAKMVGAISEIRDEYLNAEYLRIMLDPLRLNYRTTYNEQYMLECKVFTVGKYCEDVEENKVIRSENKMNIKTLIDKKRDKEISDLIANLNDSVKNANKSFVIGEKASELADLIMANSTLTIDFRSFIPQEAIPLSVKREIEHLEKLARNEEAIINNKYDELEALLLITEKNKQKVKLLKKYHIIEK